MKRGNFMARLIMPPIAYHAMDSLATPAPLVTVRRDVSQPPRWSAPTPPMAIHCQPGRGLQHVGRIGFVFKTNMKLSVGPHIVERGRQAVIAVAGVNIDIRKPTGQPVDQRLGMVAMDEDTHGTRAAP